jgi:predicted acylesterase/phospholipase RssA
VYDGGDLLVDGGVLDDLPADVMASRLDGRIVAVELQPEEEPRRLDEFDPGISGWDVLAQRLNPLRPTPRLPGAGRILLMAKDVAAKHSQRALLATTGVDLHLRPPLRSGGLLDFSRGPEVMDDAYRYASEVLERDAMRLVHHT